MIDLRNISLLDVLPSALTADESVRALSLALDPEIRDIAQAVEQLVIWPAIDSQPEAVLDELAWGFQLLQYEGWGVADVKRKRQLLKEIIEVYRRRGTLWSVLRALRVLETDSTTWNGGLTTWNGGLTTWNNNVGVYGITEWWQTGGREFTYRVLYEVRWQGLTLARIRQIMQILRQFAPLRALLEELVQTVTSPSILHLQQGAPETGLTVEVSL